MLKLQHFPTLEAPVRKSLLEAWQRVQESSAAGFVQLPEREEIWLAIHKRARAVSPVGQAPVQVRHVIVVGIGGSSLGNRVLVGAFQSRIQQQVTFLESPDPGSAALIKSFDQKGTHLVLVSKSGGTLETLTWIEWLNAKAPHLLTADNCTVIASPGEGELQKWMSLNRIPCLWIPENVGGRFSVLTAVGMFPAALIGLNVDDFRQGAAWALTQAHLATDLSAFALQSFERQQWITQLWTYSTQLTAFGFWWQQLWSESLGKKKNRTGTAAARVSTPMSCSGPRDQHSCVQQLLEGPRDKSVILHRVQALEKSEEEFQPQLFSGMPGYGRKLSLAKVLSAEADAFEKSLREVGIPFVTLQISEISERSLGALFMIWQMSIAQIGEYLNLNTFDQPGVELGKIHANEILNS